MLSIHSLLLYLSFAFVVVFGCIPTVSPDDDDQMAMMEEEMMSMMMSTVLQSTTSQTSPATSSTTASTTTTGSTTSTTTTTTTSTTTTTTTTSPTTTTTTTTLPPTCPPLPWLLNPATNFCYWPSGDTNSKIFDDAEMDCGSMGGTLVSILDQAENDWVYTNIVQPNSGTNGVWYIGLKQPANTLLSMGGMWTDNNPYGFNNFYTMAPGLNPTDDSCILMYTNSVMDPARDGKWLTQGCTIPYSYVCKAMATPAG